MNVVIGLNGGGSSLPHNKEGIQRQVNQWIEQLKNKTYQSPFSQDFAEVYIESYPPQEADSPQEAKSSILSREKAAEPSGISSPVDAMRARFLEMRGIARGIGYINSYQEQLQTVLFYKQAKFMEHFEDDFEGQAPFTMYYPNYQMMSHDQLRTYFTWRTRVRAGDVRATSLSYVFVYIYELLNRIGVGQAEDGLNRLLFLWQAYRPIDKKIDKYMPEWIKDYYIISNLPFSFDTLLRQNEWLSEFYTPTEAVRYFEAYAPLSDYKLEKSIFVTKETEGWIVDCFNHVLKTLIQEMNRDGTDFDALIFYASKGSAWQPFYKALYAHTQVLADHPQDLESKTIKLSAAEQYTCNNGQWTTTKNRVCKENGRYILGYILKRIEQFYRTATKYKYKISTNRAKIEEAEIRKLTDPDEFFDRIDAAIADYYKQSQRIEVTVDYHNLEKIRAASLSIQQKLLLGTDDFDEGDDSVKEADGSLKEADDALEETPESEAPAAWDKPSVVSPAADNFPSQPPPTAIPPAKFDGDVWMAFRHALNATETTAVRLVLQNVSIAALHELSKANHTMLEVLIDGINQKAMDTVGDSIMELADTLSLFEDYKDDLERVMVIESIESSQTNHQHDH